MVVGLLYFGDPDLVSRFDDLAVSIGADPWGFNNCLPLDRALFLDLCFFLSFRFDVRGEEEGESRESSFQDLSALDCSKNNASSVLVWVLPVLVALGATLVPPEIFFVSESTESTDNIDAIISSRAFM